MGLVFDAGAARFARSAPVIGSRSPAARPDVGSLIVHSVALDVRNILFRFRGFGTPGRCQPRRRRRHRRRRRGRDDSDGRPGQRGARGGAPDVPGGRRARSERFGFRKPELSVGDVPDDAVDEDLVRAAPVAAAESVAPRVENRERVRAGREPAIGRDPGEFRVVRTAPQRRLLRTAGRRLLLPALIR
jgi:hypothetical protein